MTTYSVSNINQDQDIIEYLTKRGVFSNPEYALHNFLFNEFTLNELGLPPADEMLSAVMAIKDKVGLRGWVTNGEESTTYRGFSLTYNPDFNDTTTSVHHQTWGSGI
jgi:hypothetical protein